MSLSPDNFVSPDVHERAVVLADGNEHTLWFRGLPNVEIRKWSMRSQSTDEDVRAAADAHLVAASLCEPDGTLSLTFEMACRLRSDVLTRLALAALAVNGGTVAAAEDLGDAAGKSSPVEPRSGSGTS